MQGTLLLATLTVRGSYGRDIELPLTSEADVPDTLQWWIAAAGAWRIRTYAIDHDIHVHQIGGTAADILTLARQNNRDHYGDVIKAEYAVSFADCRNQDEVQAEFRRVGLEPRLEIAPDRFAFWRPDDAKYSTKSEPR
jgi:hypothetical protein